jgi:hypothetical protein
VIKFNSDEYTVNVLSAQDQYNDYSVAYDVLIKVTDVVKGVAWTQWIVAGGDNQESIVKAFRTYNNNGWINPKGSRSSICCKREYND